MPPPDPAHAAECAEHRQILNRLIRQLGAPADAGETADLAVDRATGVRVTTLSANLICVLTGERGADFRNLLSLTGADPKGSASLDPGVLPLSACGTHHLVQLFCSTVRLAPESRR